MKNTNYLFSQLLLVVLTSLMIWGCRLEEPGPTSDVPSPDLLREGGMLKLGKKLENPYSVDNMKKAWNNISSRGD